MVVGERGVAAVEDHVSAHEDEIGRRVERVDRGDALGVAFGRVAAIGDVLVGEVDEGEGGGGWGLGTEGLGVESAAGVLCGVRSAGGAGGGGG